MCIVTSMCRGQKSVSDFPGAESQTVGSCVVEVQDPNSGPLKGNQASLPAEPSRPSPLFIDILKFLTIYFL